MMICEIPKNTKNFVFLNFGISKIINKIFANFRPIAEKYCQFDGIPSNSLIAIINCDNFQN